MKQRIFLVVLDSFGVGALPDAKDYGDAGSNTLAACVKAGARLPNLCRLGLGNLEGGTLLPTETKPTAAVARMAEQSAGKDTTIGHWEIAGVVSPAPLPTYPNGFPPELIAALSRETGREILCNRPYSGTKVLEDFGEAHLATGALIVYTSADSVLQIAAHEDIVPVETLYRYCEIARRLLVGKNAVGRVIARPFVGKPGSFTRTDRRHDYSLPPPRPTMLDAIVAAGKQVIAVGKISDIFAGQGITRSIRTHGNTDGLTVTTRLLQEDFEGLCFVNLVDFDMKYGHRNDPKGYAAALEEFDRWLETALPLLRPDDLLLLTADHGCDPATPSTDHSREYTPMLAVGEGVAPENLGTRESFADLSATILEALGIAGETDGKSFYATLCGTADAEHQALIALALAARKHSYCPYSHFAVGAAVEMASGKRYTGCNIENAAYSPTNCAERTALFTAVAAGERQLRKIAIVGGSDEWEAPLPAYISPCGVCRQVLSEFGSPETLVLSAKSTTDWQTHRLGELLPFAFALPPEGK